MKRAGFGAAILALAGASAAQDVPSEDVPSEDVAPPPPQLLTCTIDARARPQRATLDFTLGEEGRSLLFVELCPQGGEQPPLLRELSLRFDPFEGAHWHWTLRSADQPADVQFDAASRSTTSTPLTQIPEPKGLHYSLVLDFHAGGGLTVAFADGIPVMAAQFGGTEPLDMTIRTSGELSKLALGAVTAVGDERLATALAAMGHSGKAWIGLSPWLAAPAPPQGPLTYSGPGFSFGRLPTDPPEPPPLIFRTTTLDQAAIDRIALPPLVAVRPLEPRTSREGRLSRFILEPRAGVEVPVVVIEPATRNPAAPLIVLACGGALGKAAPDALTHQAKLAANGQVVVAFDLLGGGERRRNQSYDSLDELELRLVNGDAGDVALEELLQIRRFALGQSFAAGSSIELTEVELDAAAVRALPSTHWLSRANVVASPPNDASASPTLTDSAVFGEEYLRARYNSELFRLAVARRESVDAPYLEQSLLGRIYHRRNQFGADWRALRWRQDGVIEGIENDEPAEERLRSAPRPRATIGVSDFGPRAALFRAIATFPTDAADPPSAEGAWIGLNGTDLNSRPLPNDDQTGLDLALERLIDVIHRASVSRDARFPPTKVRLVAEGAWGVVALLAAIQSPEHIESLTVYDALPSFELLLRRPDDAVRADPRFGLLTQGMPAALFVQNVFSRYDLEEVVLALRAAGVTVDWRDPVDALRRPLDRHGRLAMWPRVRHAERPPR
ncbi:MAG: hypothetical protein EXS13_11950 [Planctomycetes bacterium]|nr:hypothetical protein [Planctomycetota bacterium]